MRLAILVMIGAAVCGAQTTVNGGRDFMGTLKATGASSSVDFRTAAGTAPVKTGTLSARPPDCTQGQVYFATDAAAGSNLSFCTTTGTPGIWSAMSAGGGGAAGAGVSYCAPSGASGSAYSCSPNPALSAYAAGNMVALVPDVNGSGGATTLNVSGLGAKAVKLADGSTNPASTDLIAGRIYFMAYDGALFRLASPTDTTNASNIASGTLADARLSANVALENRTNTYTGYNDVSGGSWRPPETTAGSLPAAASSPGRVFMVTDAQVVGACTSGGGTIRTLCRSNGSTYECIGNCTAGGGGGGSAAGLEGAMQYNNSGSFAGQPYVLAGRLSQRGMECSTGTVSYTALTANATTQEIPIIPAVTARFRFHHVLIQEETQIAGTPTLQVSMGTAGVGKDLMLPMTLKQATAPQNYGYETPRPPALGAGTYGVVLQFTGSSALGNGTTTNFTGGSIYWEVCGFTVQP